MNKVAKLSIAVLIAGMVGLVYWVVNSLPEPPEVIEEPQNHIMTHDGNTITETRDGRVIWEIKADKIDMVAETKVASLNHIKCKYFFEDGRVAEFSSDTGTYYQTTGNVELADNILGQTTDGYKLNCDKIQWESKEKILKLLGNVKVENAEKKIKASGNEMEATDDFSKFKISGKVHIEKGK